jgi:hypothetical protein
MILLDDTRDPVERAARRRTVRVFKIGAVRVTIGQRDPLADAARTHRDGIVPGDWEFEQPLGLIEGGLPMRDRRNTPIRLLISFGVLLAFVVLGPHVFGQQQRERAPGQGSAPAASKASTGPEAEVLEAEKKWETAVTLGDTAYWDVAVSDDMIFVHLTRWATGGKPNLDDRTSFRKRLVDKVYLLRDPDPSINKVELHGDVAITYGRYVNIGRPRDNTLPSISSIWYERVWQKRNDRWIFLSHRTVHGPSPAPAGVDPTVNASDTKVWYLTDPAPAPPAPKSTDEADILKIDQKFANFVTMGDTASATRGTSADFVMVHGDAWTRGQKPLAVDTQESMLARVTSKYYDVLDFDHIQAEMHGDVAVTIGRYLAHTTGASNASADRAWFAVWFERVYQKRNGQWIYLSHRTVHGPTYGPTRQAVSDK